MSGKVRMGRPHGAVGCWWRRTRSRAGRRRNCDPVYDDVPDSHAIEREKGLTENGRDSAPLFWPRGLSKMRQPPTPFSPKRQKRRAKRQRPARKTPWIFQTAADAFVHSRSKASCAARSRSVRPKAALSAGLRHSCFRQSAAGSRLFLFPSGLTVGDCGPTFRLPAPTTPLSTHRVQPSANLRRRP